MATLRIPETTDAPDSPAIPHSLFPSPRARAVALALLTLASLALRLLALDSKSLWTDEGSSYYFSQLPLADLLWRLCDPHPPGYYLLLRVVAAFGDSEFWLRFPSALAGALAVPLTWALAYHLLSKWTQASLRQSESLALLAATLLAFAPLHVWYSQEARPYALVTLLGLLMFTAGLRWYHRPSPGRALAFLASGWMALFLEYGGLLAWACLNLLLLGGLVRRPSDEASTVRSLSWRWIGLQGLLLAPFAAWWMISPQRAVLMGPSYPAVFVATQARRLGLGLTPPSARLLIGLFLSSVALLMPSSALMLRYNSRARHYLDSRLLAILTVGLLLVVSAAGVLPRLYTIKRHLVVLMPYIAVASGLALLRLRTDHRLESVRWRGPGTALAVLSLVLSLAAVLAVPKPPWRAAIHGLARAARPGNAVWVDEMDATVFAYYWRERLPWQPLYSSNLQELDQIPADQRAWLVAGVTLYRNLHASLPDGFSRQRDVGTEIKLPGILARAYDTASQLNPDVPPASEALIWGLQLPSPLDRSCTGIRN